MSNYISPIDNESVTSLCTVLEKHNKINANDFERYQVKRGLRNADGTGVMAGLTKVCSVDGYVMNDGERIPQAGKLIYRGININDIVAGCRAKNGFGFEETAWLLLLGRLPTAKQIESFCNVLTDCRELPEEFIEDMIMKAPSPNIMNKLARCVLALYSYDENPDDTSPANVLRQCTQILSQVPAIISYAYQVKRRHYDHESMVIHPASPDYNTAQTILHSIRADGQFTREEALLLDLCLIIHAEHGGGNNSTFATRVLTSSGTDTYSAIAAGIGSLKGPKHGGANIKVAEMVNYMKRDLTDINDEGQVADYLVKILKGEAGDGSGLVYGMGHAVYTVSDPRSVLLKESIESFSGNAPFMEEYRLLQLIERLTPGVFKRVTGKPKRVCANVDLYSGLVYKMLGIPEDLYTPLFTVARVAGWAAHRMEELLTGGRIIRPAYKSVSLPRTYVPVEERKEPDEPTDFEYIPVEERNL